jgi:hypothetical protein
MIQSAHLMNRYTRKRLQMYLFCLSVISCLYLQGLQAQTVTVRPSPDGGTTPPTSGLFATGWVSGNTNSVKNSGNLVVAFNSTSLNNEAAGRGWMRFDLSTAGIPAGAVINSVTVDRQTYPAIYTSSIRGYATTAGSTAASTPDPISAVSNANLFTALGSASSQWASTTFGTAGPINLGTNAVNAVQAYVNGGGNEIIVLGFQNASSIGTGPATIAGYDNSNANNRPFLTISYTAGGGGGTVPAPTITVNNSPVCEGGTIMLTASSTEPNPVFDWTGPGYSGTGATITIPNATPANAGVYSVTVTSGGNTSLPATTTVTVGAAVTPSVTITAQPSGAICPGVPVTFTATGLNGGSTPVYQWKKDGQSIGMGGTTYTDGNLNNGEVISCELTSSAGCATPSTVTSNTITTTVHPGPHQPVITVSSDTLISSGISGNQWFRNNITISGATAQHYVTQTPGWYQVEVTASGCSRRSDSVYYNPGNTGVYAYSLYESVSIYPSPFTQNITVHIRGNVTVQPDAYIISELGQVVYRGVLRTGKNELALPSLPDGVYFLLIQDSKGNRVAIRLVRK